MLPVTDNPTVILLPTSSGIYIIDTITIIRIRSISNYSKLFFSNGSTLVVAKVLAWFEDKLPQGLFVRVHRSHIINLRYVQSWCNSHISKTILQDNTVIEISRRRKRAVAKILRGLPAAILFEQAA